MAGGVLQAVLVPSFVAARRDGGNEAPSDATQATAGGIGAGLAPGAAAARGGLRSAEVTPVRLNRIGELTGARSLQANLALLKNNAAVAAQIAVALHRDPVGAMNTAAVV